MASVTFPTSLGGDGSTVTDDNDPTTGLANGGHRDRFVPALEQVVAMASTAVEKAGVANSVADRIDDAEDAATAAAASATQAALSRQYAEAAALSTGVKTYATYALADAAKSGLDDDQAILVYADENQTGYGSRYVKESGPVLTYIGPAVMGDFAAAFGLHPDQVAIRSAIHANALDLPNPTLNLDFKKGLYESRTGSEAVGTYLTADDLENIITFTRSTTALAPSGESQLAEQNLATYSQQLDNAAYTASELTVTADQATAPDGTTTADELTPSTNSAEHYIRQTKATSGAVTVSAFAEDNGYDFIWVRLNGITNSTVFFDVSGGTVETTGAGVTAEIVDYGSGRYRCVVKAASGSMTSFDIGVSNADNTLTFTGDGSSSVYAWGAQVEERSSVTDYTATADQPITRYQPNIYKQVAIDEPRIAHNLNGTIRGLMVEEARTGLFSYSADLTNGIWSLFESLVRAGQAGPFEGAHAQKLVSSAGGQAELRRTPTVTGGTSYVIETVAKAGEFSLVTLNFSAFNGTFNSERGTFDLSAGTVTITGADDYGMEPLGNGWYRCWVSATCVASDSTLLRLADLANNGDGDGYSGIYVANAQFYEGTAPPLAPIVTAGSQVTQGNELADITSGVSNIVINPDDYSVFAEFEKADVTEEGSRRIVQLDDGLNANRLLLNTTSGQGLFATQLVDAADVQDNSTQLAPGGTLQNNTVYKAAVRLSGLTLSGFFQGALTDSDALYRLPPRPTEIHIGREKSANNFLNGYVRQLRIDSPALSDQALKAVTA